MAQPTRRILEIQDVDNRRRYAGDPNGHVYGEPGYTCQDSVGGALYVCTAAGQNNWSALATGSGLPGGAIDGQVLDWEAGAATWTDTLKDSALAWSVAIASRMLYDGTGLLSCEWGVRQLNDANEAPSINWTDRLLYDLSGSTSVDWNNRQLADGVGVVSVDWTSRVLNDQTGFTCIDWVDRLLLDTSSNTVADWSAPGAFKLAPGVDLWAGTYTAGVIAPAGSISIRDSAGNVRLLLVG